MAEVMIAVMPFHGHVAPMAAVAEAFIGAGHGVRVYTGSAHASRFAALGAQVVPWRAAPDFGEHGLAATFPVLRGRKGPRQMLANVEHLFVRTGADQAADLDAAFGEEPWDVIVADGLRAVLRAGRRVSTDVSYRANAKRLAARLAEHDGPREVVEHTLRLVGEGSPG